MATNTRCNRSISVSMVCRVEHVGVEFDAKLQFAARQGLHRQWIMVVFAGVNSVMANSSLPDNAAVSIG